MLSVRSQADVAGAGLRFPYPPAAVNYLLTTGESGVVPRTLSEPSELFQVAGPAASERIEHAAVQPGNRHQATAAPAARSSEPCAQDRILLEAQLEAVLRIWVSCRANQIS